jgi:aminoglycoside 3'-phosphotransferase II
MELPPFPPELRYLQIYRAREQTDGLSGAGVFRLEAQNRPTLIVKLSMGPEAADLFSEAARVRWLRSSGVPAPRVLHVTEGLGGVWLVMTCVAGENAATSSDPPAVKVRQLAHALRAIHALDPGGCPFDETINAKLARAKARLTLHQLDEGDFEHQTGTSPEEVLREIEQLRPSTEDIVVTHGDACLENVMLVRGCFSGFVDCGRLGRSDRYQDLALACRSISELIAGEWIGPFLEMYGIPFLNENRARFYLLLDEFF